MQTSSENTQISSAEKFNKLKISSAAGEENDLQVVIRAVYRQVLGNVSIMEAQRLTSAESRLRNGDFTIRDFVRELALSDLYRSYFFETSSPYRFVELNFKHLLGRAPQDQAEIAEHVLRYNTQGYEAEINSYIDSEEYTHSFGENGVPHLRGNQTQVGSKNVVFARTSTLDQGYATSDSSNQSTLISGIALSQSPKIQAPSRSSSAISKVQTGLPNSDGPKTLKDVRSAPYTEDRSIIIRSAYRQVLGNAHVMESERLSSAESRVQNGEYTVREFIRAIALSDLYRSLFFETSSPYRFVELNFKHLLGRAPQDQAEIAEHVMRYTTQGYETEINSYIDSEEYINSFGENEVPHIRGNQTQVGSKNIVFGRTSALNQGYATSDAGSQSELISKIAMSLATKVESPSRSSSAISKVQTGLPNSDGPKTLKDVRSAPYTEDRSIIIRSAYRQVLGNAHVMESERLSSAESRVQNGEYTVREFIRAIALSDLYRSLFFETSSPYRFVELNFKHLLGRAPQDQTEIAEHVIRYTTQGYEAEINSYIDSEEYTHSFGENEVPHIRGNQTQVGIKSVVYGRTFALQQGYAGSNKGQKTKLMSSITGNLPTKIKPFRSRGSAVSSTEKRYQIATTRNATTAFNQLRKETNTVSYSQLSRIIQRIHKSGAKILSITEIN